MSILSLKRQPPDFLAAFPHVEPAGETAGFLLFRQGSLLMGWRATPVDPSLKETARQVYGDLFSAAQGLSLYRIWNQVPAINETPLDLGLENYRAFSAGRAEAFERHHGPGFSSRLPAASAVGTDMDELTVAFVAGPAAPRHFENPEQVPAYRYPPEHGPRAPSFARATAVTLDDRNHIFISGTAAIKGHVTVAETSLARQIDCTLDNLRLISSAAGSGPELGRGRWHRLLRIYLRSGADRVPVEAAFRQSLFAAGDRIEWRQAHLCRSALRVEVEATLTSA